ncbi:MAG TPA: sugar phosphate isomerase/epimerase [Nakamurella multipartita]|nr:sugar phosphate isomerase/epimerase [Nakamurella multipartita]
MADRDRAVAGGYELVASFFTLTGSGFGQPPRHSFTARCEAAADAGFTGIGLHVDDLPRTVAAGLDVPGMQAVLARTGLRVVEIEFLGGWAPPDSDPAELDALVNRIEAVADAFGGRHVSTGEFRGPAAPGDRLDLDAAAGRLAALADRLAERDLLLAVEGFPWSVLAGADTVPDLVRRTQSTNVGQLVDIWHYLTNGADPVALTGPVAAVQLNDGPRVEDDFLTHARAARRLPGEGELDVVGLIRAVLHTGFTGPWCIEVNTPEFRSLPIEQAAAQAVRAARAVLTAAGAPPTVPAPSPDGPSRLAPLSRENA